MARAFGLDLRRRVVEAIDGGMSARGAAARYSIGISTAIHWHRQWRETGSIEPGRQGKPAGSKLDAHEAFILDLVDEQKDIALHEIAATLAREQGLRSCPATVWYFLSKRGGSGVTRPLPRPWSISWGRAAAGVGWRQARGRAQAATSKMPKPRP